MAFFLSLGHEYGDVSFARFGPWPVYMINEPRLVEELLVGNHRDCIKDKSTRDLSPLVGNGLLTSEGDFWRKQRKIASPPMQPKRIAAYAATAADCAERAFAAYGDDDVRDVQIDMMRLTLEIVSKTLLGVDAQNEATRIGDVLDAFMAYYKRQMYSWEGFLPLSVPTPARRRMRRAVRELDAIIYAMIARCRRDDRDAEHFLARLVNARDENGDGMTDAQLRDEAVTMLLAGHETSALALSYCVYLLATHPDVARRLTTDVDALLDADPSRAPALPSVEYLDAVVREALRLYPPSYAIGREATRAFQIGGYEIPKGAQLVVSQYALQRDARFFPSPRSFTPERWLAPAIDALPRYAYLPFGGGPRVCVGNHFAMMEIAIVLGVLVRHVEVSTVPGFELKLTPLVTLRNEGVTVRLKKRHRA
jgi:cytochrome P450